MVGTGFGLRTLRFLLPAAMVISACAKDDIPLEGEREPIRLDVASAVTGALEDAPAVGVAAARRNSDWTSLNGGGDHAPGHLALDHPVAQIWSTSIGSGNSKKARITSGPIVAGNRVYAIDAGGAVTALSLDGAPVWRRDLAIDGEGAQDGFGGGVAYGSDTLVATTGYAEVVALEPETGEVRWRQRLDAPARAPAVVADGLAFVVARDNEAFAIDLKNGRIRWRLEGVEAEASMLGGASPAISRGLVVLPFGSGEVVGALARNGRRVWTSSIAGGRRGTVRAKIFDITGDPVMDGDSIFVANHSGRLIAIDRSSGDRSWIVNDGAAGPVLPVGNSVFYVNDLAQLKRIDRATGDVIWAVQLPLYRNPDKKRGVVYYTGPLLAGGSC